MLDGLAPGHPYIRRVMAENPGPMTLTGTNTYVYGNGPCWVIDPGPEDEAHIEAVKAVVEELGGAEGVLLTHSHADHTGGVELLGLPVIEFERGMGPNGEAAEVVPARDGVPAVSYTHLTLPTSRLV